MILVSQMLLISTSGAIMVLSVRFYAHGGRQAMLPSAKHVNKDQVHPKSKIKAASKVG